MNEHHVASVTNRRHRTRWVLLGFLGLAACSTLLGALDRVRAQGTDGPTLQSGEYVLGPMDKVRLKVFAWRPARDVTTSAKRAIALADTRVSQVITALDGLVAAGVRSCVGADLDAMQRTRFAVPPLKELAMVDPEGGTRCTHFGSMYGRRIATSSEPLAGTNYLIEVVEVADRDHRVRVRRQTTGDYDTPAGLLPAELFVPQVSTHGGQLGARARMFTASGAVLGENGSVPAGKVSPPLTVRSTSNKFGFVVEMAVPQSAIGPPSGDLERLGLLAKITVGIVLIGFTLLLPRPQRDNPVAELERALEAGEFIPYYQPIVDIRSGQLRGAEVLIRWKKPDGTLVLPGAFVPLAELSGLILAMTRRMMRHVCSEIGTGGRRAGAQDRLQHGGAIVSATESIVKEVRNAFAGSPIDLSQVVLELTERDPIENLTETRRVIAALQGIGVRIAIDDVGTGHSGLSYMLKLGVDIIKIDKMFVDAIGCRPQPRDHRGDADRSRAQHAHGCDRGRGGDVRTGHPPARSRQPSRPRLRLFPAAPGGGLSCN